MRFVITIITIVCEHFKQAYTAKIQCTHTKPKSVLKGKTITWEQMPPMIQLDVGWEDGSVAKTSAAQAKDPSSNPQHACKCQVGVVAQLQSPHQEAETGDLSRKLTSQTSTRASSEFSGRTCPNIHGGEQPIMTLTVHLGLHSPKCFCTHSVPSQMQTRTHTWATKKAVQGWEDKARK